MVRIDAVLITENKKIEAAYNNVTQPHHGTEAKRSLPKDPKTLVS